MTPEQRPEVVQIGPSVMYEYGVHTEGDLPGLEAEAVTAWNTRATPTHPHEPQALVEELEPFGYWIEQKHAEPALLRNPAYIPEPSNLRTVTPLYLALPVVDDELVEHVARAIYEASPFDWSGDFNRDYADEYPDTKATLRKCAIAAIQALSLARKQIAEKS